MCSLSSGWQIWSLDILLFTVCFVSNSVDFSTFFPPQKSSLLNLIIYLFRVAVLSCMSPEDSLNAKPTFASFFSAWQGTLLLFLGIVCVQMCRFACVFVERARDGRRETYHVPLTDGDYSRRPSMHSSFRACALLCEWARERKNKPPWLITYNLAIIYCIFYIHIIYRMIMFCGCW